MAALPYRRSVLSVLRHRDFRLLWAGQTASVIGDGLVLVAVGLFVTRLTGRAGDVGLVLACYSLPMVGLVLFGGVVADRLPRQLLMVCSDVVRGGAHAVLAVLIVTGVVQVWQMMVIGAVYGCGEAFFRPAYTGLVPQTVPEGEIQQAQALGGVSREIATFASPALATALVLGVSAAAAFALDAATFVVSALLLLRVRTRDRGVRGERAGMLHELREGAVAVRERAWVWATIATFSFALLVALAPFFTLGAATAQTVYGSEAVYGIANAFWGLGTLAGALSGSRWKPRYPMRAGLLAALAWPGSIAVFALGPPVAVTYAVMVGAGAGIGVFAVWWETALAQRIPPHLLSRVSAWDWMGSLALLPLGYLLSGPAADLLGVQRVMVGGGLLGSAAMLLALIPRSTRQLARLDEGDESTGLPSHLPGPQPGPLPDPPEPAVAGSR